MTSSVDHDSAFRRQTARAQRWHGRSVAAVNTTLERLRHCGRTPTSYDDGVAVRLTPAEDGSIIAGFSGLQHCGSVWACPVCSASIVEERRQLLAEVLKRWRRQGGRVVMITLTVRHKRSDSLKTVWDAVAKGWQAATSGRHWRQWGEVLGFKGPNGTYKIPYFRATETTVSTANGWHVHIHALLFVHQVNSMALAIETLADVMWMRWDARVQAMGLSSGERRFCEAHLVTGDADEGPLADYFNKATYELTSGQQNKLGKAAGHYTPFQLLAQLAGDASGLASAQLAPTTKRRLLRWWAEWETASRGRRQMSWSQGLFDLVNLDRDAWRDDQDIVDDDTLGGKIVARIDSDDWRRMTRLASPVFLLEAFERSETNGTEYLALLSHLIAKQRQREDGE